RRASFVDLASGEQLDDGLVLWFPGPRSATGEDVAEFHVHGSRAVLAAVMEALVRQGLRLAEPGEFTRRAFLNGKLDLLQAEAIIDLIDASTAQAAKSAMRSLHGDFSSAIQDVTTQLVELRALLEATLDFPEEEIDPLDH